LAIVGAIEISDDPARLDGAVIERLLRDAYWSANRTPERIERSLRNSVVVGAYDGKRQVGLARVVTDRATFAWLCDVIVDEDYRSRGIGKALVAATLAHKELQGMRWVLATSDAHELYRRFGFTELAAPERLMEHFNP
jgi:N-acetylglutamate synthase-like GNAT family acetyltransferase